MPNHELIKGARRLRPEHMERLSDEELGEIAWLLTEAEHDHMDSLCAQVDVTPGGEASEKSGSLYWLQSGLTMTTDDHWQTTGRPHKAPFPRKSYLRFVFGALLRLVANPELQKDVLFIPKSRDMLVSWSVMGFITWMCQWRPQTFWITQADKEDKAGELLRYARTLYYNQPDWLQRRHVLEMDNLLEMRWTNGSRLLAVAAGEDQIRVHHPHGWFADEAAFLSNFEQCLNAVVPVAAQIIAISTATPGFFGDQCSE
jgi:hypothetical protein